MHKLKEKRTARRQQNTRIINEAKTVLDTADVETLGSLIERLQSNNDELSKLNAELEDAIPDEEFAAEFQSMMKYEDAAKGMLGQLKAKEKSLRSGTRLPESTAPATAVESHSDERHRHVGSVKLPTLQLQTFNGELCQWLSFWTQFKAAVHENPSLNNGEKFHYLRSLLGGSAASSIAGLQPTEDCYPDAVEILSRRFGDTRRIVQEHLAQLRVLPSVVSSNDVGGLRRLLDHVQCHVRGLAALKVSSATYSTMMTDVLLRALPSDIVVAYHRQVAHSSQRSSLREGESSVGGAAAPAPPASFDGELDALLAHLMIEVECRERSGVESKKEQGRPEAHDGKEGLGMPPTAAVLNSSASRGSNCLFCDSDQHYTQVCDGSISHKDRIRKLAADRRCFRCTLKGHFSKECRRNVTCANCNGRHVSSVCDPSWQRRETDRADNVRKLDASSLHSSNLPILDTEILLQTYRLWIYGGRQCAYVRGIVDGGSQRSFIREDVSRNLGLRELGKTSLQLNIFGQDKSATKECRVVELVVGSQYNDELFSVEAIEVPFICKDIVQVPMESDFVLSIEATGQPIADKLLQSGMAPVPGISLLLGADHLWKVMTGEVHRHPRDNRLVALNSVFGWMFQGPLSVLSSSGVASNVCVLKVSPNCEAVGEVVSRFWGPGNIEMFESKPVDDENERSVPSRHRKGGDSKEPTLRKWHQACDRRRRTYYSDQYHERPASTTGLQSNARNIRSFSVAKAPGAKWFPQKASQNWSSQVFRLSNLPSMAQSETKRATKKRPSVLSYHR